MLEFAAPDHSQDVGRVEGNSRDDCMASFGQLLDRVREEKIGLAKHDERGLLVLDERLGLFHVNIHPFRIVWVKEILHIYEWGIASGHEYVITTVRSNDGEDLTY